MTSITCLQCLLLIPISLFLFLPVIPVLASTTLAPNQSLAGDETLVSEDQCFEFGFFSPGVSRNRYLGIWYKNISPQTVVWVANRNTPLTDSFGVLKMDEYGNLLLVNKSKKVIWSSKGLKQRSPIAEETITKLLDSGNLIVRKVSGNDNDPNSYQWQSFDHLTNTFLQGMKLGWDLGVGVNNSLTSWKSDEDPSPGEYLYGMAPGDSPELYLFKQQSIIYRSGPWNGVMFSGVPEVKPSDGFFTEFVINGTQKLQWFVATHQYGISRVVMDKSGKLLRLVSLGGGQGWTDYWHGPRDECDNYKKCGAYGICFARDDLPICKCVKGFQPKNQSNWNSKDTLGGCVRKRNFLCGKDDGFLKFKGMKLPDCSKAYYNHSMNLKECAHMCKKNCSCTAYARSDIRKGVDGCLNWYGDLVDLRQYTAYGQTLYVRVVASELDNHDKSIVIIIAIIVMSTVLLLGSICFIWRKRILQQRDKDNRKKSLQLAQSEMFFSKELENDNLELPLLDFHVIAATTEDFSDKNMLGQGGFGYVYKGSFANGQQIAVKRLSKTSGQGVDEFKNEVMLIAKLQHRNLVRLLGCCIDNDERILIYEYMPNKSLDYFLFDKSQRLFLDWGRRFNIIVGIARGLLYLHQDSRLKIIHRDLKASNILLDDEMNPKISDFGMARIFGSNQSEANTNRVVGTYGYMAPEYAMDGLFSLKSDVFSYGVLVLEIISGKKNKGFYTAGNELNLLGYAWILWEQGKGLELMDESMGDTLSTNEVLKCIQIGLLCVQERAEDRPSISSVILMLGSEITTLAQPKQPGFSLGRSTNGAYSSSNDQESCSVSEGTTAMLEAR